MKKNFGEKTISQPEEDAPAEEIVPQEKLSEAIARAAGGDSEVTVIATCSQCGRTAKVNRPEGIDPRHWLSHHVVDHVTQAMHAAGCKHW